MHTASSFLRLRMPKQSSRDASSASFPAYAADLSDAEDEAIDFSNAVLYVGALQTILATAAASFVSILSCWLLPAQAISAVRTLVLSSIVATLLVRKPFRLGKVHGLGLIFNALRPCVAIYIASMILEQLVHTCTRDSAAPSWRRLVFHCCVVVAMLSGFARARKPLEQTDAPFLVTGLALFVIAMLPPPAIILAGPLCSEPSFASSSERLVRSLVFSLLYCTFVYASAPPVQSSGEVVVCVMRASAASLWVLGCHLLLLPLSIVQAGVVIYVRIYGSEYQIVETEPLLICEDEIDNVERGGGGTGHRNGGFDSSAGDSYSQHEVGLARSTGVDSPSHRSDHHHEIVAAPAVSTAACSSAATDMISPSFSALGARGLVDISTAGSNEQAGAVTAIGGPMSKERLAQIAAAMQ